MGKRTDEDRLADISVPQIATFLAIADEGGVGRAARALGTSQPSVSSSLGRFERELGAKVFDRLPQGMVLNHVGRSIVHAARETIASLASFEATARRLRDGDAGELVVGLTYSRLQFIVLPRLIRLLQARVPQARVRIALHSDDQSLMNDLRVGRVDLVIADNLSVDSTYGDDLVAACTVTDSLALALPPSSPHRTLDDLRRARHVTIVQLAGERRYVDQLASLGVKPVVAVVDALVSFAPGLVSNGVGAAVLSSAMAEVLARLGCHCIELPPPYISATVAYRAEASNPLVRVVDDLLSEWPASLPSMTAGSKVNITPTWYLTDTAGSVEVIGS